MNQSSSVDIILASGAYTDTGGNKWKIVTFTGGWGRVDEKGFALGGITVHPELMRKLIENDKRLEHTPESD